MTTPKKPGPTPAMLQAVVEAIAEGRTLADAMRLVHRRPNTIFTWLKASRDLHPDFDVVRWPDPDGPPVQFAEAVVTATRAHLMHFRQRLIRDCDVGTPRPLRSPSGEPVWEICALTTAQWGGDADAARRLGGLTDPFYKHDASGARVQVVVMDAAPSALRIHAARSVLSDAGFNPADRREVDAQVSGGVMIMKATTQGEPSPYARPTPLALPAPSADAALSPLKADLLRRLSELRARGPLPPDPSKPVAAPFRAAVGDPPDDRPLPRPTIPPRESRRAYQADGGASDRAKQPDAPPPRPRPPVGSGAVRPGGWKVV